MEYKSLMIGDEWWDPVARHAEHCSWHAGKNLAKWMRSNSFLDWERVIVACEGNEIAGYCTFAHTDCIPNLIYTPYIGFVYVGEAFRGNGLSRKLIEAALNYAKEVGFDKVYLISDHINLYEKYGFKKIDEKPAPWNKKITESIFMHEI